MSSAESETKAIDFERFLRNLHEPAWSTEQRRLAWKCFSEAPAPSRKDEEWKYTDLTGFKTDESPREFAVTISSSRFVTALSMPDALEKEAGLLKNLPGTDKADRFSLFARSTWTNGYFVRVPAGMNVDAPVIVLHSAHSIASSRSVIVAEPGSRVTVCEVFEGEAPLHYSTLDVFAKENAEVNILIVQRFSGKTWDCSYKRAVCDRDARVNWTFALLGGRASRLKEETVFNGPGASSEVKGIYFGSGKQHFSVLTNNYHVVQNTTAKVDTRGVLKNSASSVTRGLIRIEKTARGTESYLRDRTLHLGGGATSNAIPSLEIENNDVRASHGASTGKIEEDQLFYLMSRGLARPEAERLVVEGFFEPIVEAISVKEVRDGVKELLEKKITAVEA